MLNKHAHIVQFLVSAGARLVRSRPPPALSSLQAASARPDSAPSPGCPARSARRKAHGPNCKARPPACAPQDYADPAGQLCTAAGGGDMDQLKQLLDNGVAPDLGDYDARSALHLAASEALALPPPWPA